MAVSIPSPSAPTAARRSESRTPANSVTPLVQSVVVENSARGSVFSPAMSISTGPTAPSTTRTTGPSGAGGSSAFATTGATAGAATPIANAVKIVRTQDFRRISNLLFTGAAPGASATDIRLLTLRAGACHWSIR